MNKNGFAIVEVLVAFVILSMTISLLTYTQKNFQEQMKRLYHYENLYTTVLSLKNKIDIELRLGDKMYYTGKLNNYNYRIDIFKKKEGRNIEFDSQMMVKKPGNFRYMFYEVIISMVDIEKKYIFYKVKCIPPKQKEGIF